MLPEVRGVFDPGIVAITDRRLCGEGRLIPVCKELVDAGVGAILLREKDLTARELYELALGIRRIVDGTTTRLVVSDRIDVAIACGADGVHLAGHSLPWEKARSLLPLGMLLGASCHQKDELKRAADADADYVFLSPVFPPLSKTSNVEPLGADGLKELARNSKLPVYALGGISLSNLEQLTDLPIAGVAGIDCFFGANDPSVSVRTIKNYMSL